MDMYVNMDGYASLAMYLINIPVSFALLSLIINISSISSYLSTCILMHF